MRTFVLMALLMAGCDGDRIAEPTTPTVRVGEEFTLAPGGTASVRDLGWRVTFDKVSEDSRCPIDAVCVWEGDAVTEVAVVPGTASPEKVQLHTNRTRDRETKIGDAYLRLVRLTPVGRADVPVKPEEYRATFVASRTPSADSRLAALP